MEVKYLAWVGIATLSSCGAPAFAQSCYPAGQALEVMTENGYTVTMTDVSGMVEFFIAEDGRGGWVVFAIQGELLCPIVGGSGGVRTPLPPNA